MPIQADIFMSLEVFDPPLSESNTERGVKISADVSQAPDNAFIIK